MAVRDVPVDRGVAVGAAEKKPYAAPVLEILDSDRTETGFLGAQADGTNSSTATSVGS